MSENNLFPRRSNIFKDSVLDVRDSVARPALDTLYQVSFSFGKYETWLKGVNFSDRKRTQGQGFQNKMSLLCTEAEIPGTRFETSNATGHYQGIQEAFPNLRSFPPLNLTFYCDADMMILQVLETWMTYINPIQTNQRQLNAYSRLNYPDDYKEIIHITKFERDSFLDGRREYQSNMSSYEFVNVWPSNLTSMRVAYGDPNVLKCSVELTYDRFFTRFDYNDPNQAVLNTKNGIVNSNDQLKSGSGLSPSQKAKLNFGYDLNVFPNQ